MREVRLLGQQQKLLFRKMKGEKGGRGGDLERGRATRQTYKQKKTIKWKKFRKPKGKERPGLPLKGGIFRGWGFRIKEKPTVGGGKSKIGRS